MPGVREQCLCLLRRYRAGKAAQLISRACLESSRTGDQFLELTFKKKKRKEKERKEKLGVVTRVYDPSVGEVGTGRSLTLTG